MHLKGRAKTRGNNLLPECKKAKPIFEPIYDGYYCWGLIDLINDEPCNICWECKAFCHNIEN